MLELVTAAAGISGSSSAGASRPTSGAGALFGVGPSSLDDQGMGHFDGVERLPDNRRHHRRRRRCREPRRASSQVSASTSSRKPRPVVASGAGASSARRFRDTAISAAETSTGSMAAVGSDHATTDRRLDRPTSLNSPVGSVQASSPETPAVAMEDRPRSDRALVDGASRVGRTIAGLLEPVRGVLVLGHRPRRPRCPRAPAASAASGPSGTSSSAPRRFVAGDSRAVAVAERCRVVPGNLVFFNFVPNRRTSRRRRSRGRRLRPRPTRPKRGRPPRGSRPRDSAPVVRRGGGFATARSSRPSSSSRSSTRAIWASSSSSPPVRARVSLRALTARSQSPRSTAVSPSRRAATGFSRSISRAVSKACSASASASRSRYERPSETQAAT